ncbi:MAG TPA: polysaccharide deacetylase family protein [Polyangia bacterium]|nr:polysaccharide deacetylase family protein [Polyangia bacterium]
MLRRGWRCERMAGGVVLLVAAASCGGARPGGSALAGAATAAAGVTLDVRLLLVAVDGNEPALAAMRGELDEIGTPYTVVTTASAPVVASALSDNPGHGLYDGIVRVACGAGTGPDAASVSALDAYAAAFGVRSACLFARGDTALGLGAGNSVDTRTAPISLQYTADGTSVFGWYATNAPVQVSGVAAVLAAPTDATTTPLLVDPSGDAAVAIHRFADGHELMLLTFDQAPGAPHSSQLLCGVASWLGRGVFIGEKRAYLTPQPDDLFIGTVLSDGTTFRMSGDDLRSVAAWQQRVQAMPVGTSFRVTFPFVGVEASDSDDLTQAARQVGPQFFFVSHTFDHHRLDAATSDQMTTELTKNDAVMQKYAFGPYDKTSLVTPDISGLANAQILQAAVDWGIQRVVCDATLASCRGPAPNTGLSNPVVPGMFMIPRLATNLYANVSTPDQWVSSYDFLNSAAGRAGWSIGQIEDSESNTLLAHLLAGDIYPVMFHQTNLRAYDGTHALMTDLIDQVISKYAALRVLPIVSLAMDEMGARMQDRAARDAAGVSATLTPGKSITIRAAQAVRVPVTGAVGDAAEAYGAVTISRVTLAAGAEITLPLADPAADGGSGTDGRGDGGKGAAFTGQQGAASTGTSGGGCGCALSHDGRHDDRPAVLWIALAAAAVARARSRRRPARPAP